MVKLIHSMLRVSDLERSILFYQQALELNLADRFPFKDFTLVYLKNKESAFELELTFNHSPSEEPVHGNQYGHLAVSVADINSVHQKLTNLNLQPSKIKCLQWEEQLLATFFFISDPDGYKIEFIERKGRYI